MDGRWRGMPSLVPTLLIDWEVKCAGNNAAAGLCRSTWGRAAAHDR